MKLSTVKIFSIVLVWAGIAHGSDFVTIHAPADASTVTGLPLAIDGSSSRAGCPVVLTVNTTEIGTATTDGSGDWSFSLDNLGNGSYAINARLYDADFNYLATSTNNFTVQNPPTIYINNPTQDQTVLSNPSLVTGGASLANTDVRVSLDGVVITTTASDSSGNWQAPYAVASSGSHELLAELRVAGVTVATSTADFTSLVPIVFPAGLLQMRVVDGDVPTTGSGSGNGFTYSVSGSTITINFSPVFSSAPSITTTGQRAAGASTVTLSAVSANSCNLMFSTGTQRVHFTAASFS